MLIITQHTNLLQIFFKFMPDSKVISKRGPGPDDTCRYKETSYVGKNGLEA